MTELSKDKEMFLTARVTLVIEYRHPSAWQTSCQAEQVFNAAQREATNAAEQLFIEHGEGKFSLISSEPMVVMGTRKK